MNGAGSDRSRRGFLNWFLGTSVGALCVSVFYPVARYISPPDVPEAKSARAVAARDGELKPGDGRIFRFGNDPALLIRTEDGAYRAFSAKCTHLNCTVQYRGDLKQIWCACHAGFYDLNGAVVAGPPPRPLEAFTVNVSGGDIVVSRT